MADTSEGCAVLQRDLDRLEKWANRSLMESNKGNHKALSWRRNNPRHWGTQCTQVLSRYSPAAAAVHRKDLEALMDTRLSKIQSCALMAKEASDTLGCFRQSSASKGGGDPSPPLCTGGTNLGCCVQCWPPCVPEVWIQRNELKAGSGLRGWNVQCVRRG